MMLFLISFNKCGTSAKTWMFFPVLGCKKLLFVWVIFNEFHKEMLVGPISLVTAATLYPQLYNLLIMLFSIEAVIGVSYE